MDFSNKKYIKYKTKYVELKGGMSKLNYNDYDYEPDDKEIERLEKVRLERLVEKERLDKLERDRLERDRLDKLDKLERDKLENDRSEQNRLERDRLERDRLEIERSERERLDEKKRVDTNMEYLKKIGNEARNKENAMKEFITILDRIDINKNQLLEEIENVLIKDNVESKKELLTVLKKYKQEINNKKLAINKIKEVYDYIPSDIREKMVFETILR